MKKNLNRFLLALLISSPICALGDVDTTVQLSGEVLAFSETTVSVSSGNQRVEVPRSLFPVKVKIGEQVSVPMTEDELAGLKKENLKKK